MNDFVLKTKRVGLRKYCPTDLEAFAAMNADPQVMEFFPEFAKLSPDEAKDVMERMNARIDQQGFGFWAAENLDDHQLMGFIGIQQIPYETEFTPAVEIGWRLAVNYWGKGLATEGAEACLSYAFGELDLERIVSFTTPLNERSIRVMQRLGMTQCGSFDHPLIPEGHLLREHVWYSLESVDY
jgi:3-dehydroquinate dehydratase/shikimate dehydrogenase